MGTTNFETAKVRGNNPKDLKSVLVIRFSALGDVAMTVPVIYSACLCYPDVHFTMVTRKSMAPIFINPPKNLSVVGLDLKNDYKGVTGVRRLFVELRRSTQFDGVIDLHDVLRTKLFSLFSRLCCIPVSTINKGRKGKRALTRRHNKVLLPLISSRARYRQAFHRIGLPVESRFNGFFNNQRGDLSAVAAITPPKGDNERWIGFAPFAKHLGKIYPPELMEEVVSAIAKLPNVKLFLFGGGADEEAQLQQWADRYPHTVSLAGKRYGFPVELALVSWLDVMVSMDSANMHLASLVKTPVISIWGATHPYCGFKGWRQNESDTIQLPMTCRPCSVFGNKPCYRGDYHCLRGIAPAVIVEKIKQHLDSN
jgi:ADP-heptose:LPS heptosyltransferase